MIYDCFLYNGEVELLEIRVNELAKCKQPVTHVLIESQFTFTGNQKPLYYANINEIFAEYPILSVSLSQTVDGSPWDREKFQRNMIMDALKLLNPADENIIIISDVDEIPNHAAVDTFHPANTFAALKMKKFGYYLNYLESGEEWDRARIMDYAYLKERSPEEVRNSGYVISIPDAGWHFGWLHNRAMEKIGSFSHTELNHMHNQERICRRENFWNGAEMKSMPIDESFPEYLRNNIYKFKHLIKTA